MVHGPQPTAASEWVKTHGRTAALHAASLIVLRLSASFWARSGGLHALSDDDFARMTISQLFALHPRLDPTATSWLPAPFWAVGTAMMVFGRSIAVAEVLTAVVTSLSVVVLYAAARVAGASARAALIAAAVCTLTPVAWLVGAASVPDFAVAAACGSALVLLRASDVRWLLASSALILIATLSRYEPWPAALVIAIAACVAHRGSNPRRHARVIRGAAALLAMAGPCLWIAWNGLSHGDVLHFHARVSSYRSALGGVSGAWHALRLGYLPALASDGSAIALIAVIALVAAASRKACRSWARSVIGAAVVLVALVLADATGGAPTHHPERALLSGLFVLWIVVIDLFDRGVTELGSGRGRLQRWVGAGAVTIVFVAIRMHCLAPGYGVDRRDEVRVGQWLQGNMAPGERVLVDPVDYGYFAIMAGSGAPERIALSRSLDPRARQSASPFESQEELRATVTENWLVASDRESLRKLGEVRAVVGRWEIAKVNPSSPTGLMDGRGDQSTRRVEINSP